MSLQTRRQFVRRSVLAGTGLFLTPAILSATAGRPRSPLRVGQIGLGRIAMDVDMRWVLRSPSARIVAVCDVDAKRLKAGREAAEGFYREKGESAVDIKAYADHRELLARDDIDAVVISTPDHSHALIAVQAALAGKHMYVQKPLTWDIAESLALERVTRARNIVLQVGSQQRSSKPFPNFRPASEAVRNGRLGKIQRVEIGIGLDKPKGIPPEPQQIPPNLNYDLWLGSAPEQPYMQLRVHPQEKLGRPGWITTEDFGLGMITNWGSHHIDIAQWALGCELGGPTDIAAKATFMQNDVWTVHHTYHVEMTYPHGVKVVLDDSFPNGIRFIGEEGWIFCSRGDAAVTASDGNAAQKKAAGLEASTPSLLEAGPDFSVRWPQSPDHMQDWIDAVFAGRDPIAPVDQGARTMEACAAAWIAMKLGRPVRWDPIARNFGSDREAQTLCSRPARKPEYDYRRELAAAGLS